MKDVAKLAKTLPDPESGNRYEKLRTKLKNYYLPKKNKHYARHQFLKLRPSNPGESTTTYAARLREKKEATQIENIKRQVTDITTGCHKKLKLMNDIPIEYNDIHPYSLEPIHIRSVDKIAHHHPNASIVATITAKKPTAHPSGSDVEHAIRKITSHLCVDQRDTQEQAISETMPDHTTKEEESSGLSRTMHQPVQTMKTLFKLSQRVSRPSKFAVYAKT